MTTSRNDYFGWNKLLSLILAIFPLTSFVLGFLTRLSEGKIVAAILRLILGWNIIWIIDLISIVSKGKIFRILNI